MSKRGPNSTNLVTTRIFVVLFTSGLCLNAYLLRIHWRDIGKGYADFTIFYSAADIVRSGHAKDLYNEQIQYRAQLAVAPDVTIRNWALPYNHPPFEVLLFVPFRCLPYLTAFLVWALLNMGMVFLAIQLMRGAFGPLSQLPSLALFLAVLTFFPDFIALFQEQDVVLLLLLVSAAYALIQRGHDFSAGCSLGLGVFRPELVLPIALLIMVARGKRFATGFFAVAAGLAMISCLVVGWQGFLDYPAYVWQMERIHGHGSIIPAEMPNLRGFVSLLSHNKSIRLLGTTLTSCVVFAISMLRIRSTKIALNAERLSCVVVLCSLLVSFHALIHDLALLAIPMMFVCAEWIEGPQPLSSRKQAVLFWPGMFFACTPVVLFLWRGLERFSLVALALIVWLWGILTVLPPNGEGTQFLARSA